MGATSNEAAILAATPSNEKVTQAKPGVDPQIDMTEDGHPVTKTAAEELLSNPDNNELKNKKRQPTESAIGKKHPNTSGELPSNNSIRNPGDVVNPEIELTEDGHPVTKTAAEELLSNPDNIELKIEKRQPTESATGEKHPNTSGELPSNNSIRNPGDVVNPEIELTEDGHPVTKTAAEELLSNPDNIELKNKKRQPTESATGTNQSNTSNELPSGNSIRNPGEVVNGQFSLSKAEQAYTDAVSRGDMKMAQKMVDQAAKEAAESAKNPTGEGGVRYSLSQTEIQNIQNIGRKSINSFNSQDIAATEQFSRRYLEEMGTKSPFFRSWFGDWRANDSTPIQIATKQGDARGIQKNNDTGWDIQVSRKVFNETSAHKQVQNVAARRYLPYINDIVQNAVLLDSYGIDKSKSPNTLLMHSLYAVADTGNGPELIKLYVEEMNNPNSADTGKRAYQLQNIESQQLSAKGSGSSLAPSISTADIHSVADLATAVKQHDANFAPKDASKIVNDDGTPKVVYHGSYKNFSVFDGSASKHSNAPSASHFFTDDIDVGYSYTGYKNTAKPGGHAYQGGVYPVYLNVRNPYTVDFGGRLWSEKVNGMDVNETVQYAKDNGYDGVIIQNVIDEGGMGDQNWDESVPKKPATDYVVFDSSQIKSATDNIGTFDGSNPDIRYSLSEQGEVEDIAPVGGDSNIHFSLSKAENVKAAEQHFGTTYKISEGGCLFF